MPYSLMADAVVAAHFGFILFVALGGIAAWRWPWLLRLHLPTVAWAAGIVTIGYDCPLTSVERWLRTLAGEHGYTGGFVDRYIEGVIYPEQHAVLLRGLVVVAVVVGWAGVAAARRRPIGGSPPQT